MFGIGMPELIIIFVIALLVFGPKELPRIGKTIGRAMAEFRRASDDLKEGIQREIDAAERDIMASVDAEPTPEEPPQPQPAADTVTAPPPGTPAEERPASPPPGGPGEPTAREARADDAGGPPSEERPASGEPTPPAGPTPARPAGSPHA
ncbi:MAG: twin-arginine translocase TatA/TatE family subunit [Candidatus Methylomirabilales bacterium]